MSKEGERRVYTILVPGCGLCKDGDMLLGRGTPVKEGCKIPREKIEARIKKAFIGQHLKKFHSN